MGCRISQRTGDEDEHATSCCCPQRCSRNDDEFESDSDIDPDNPETAFQRRNTEIALRQKTRFVGRVLFRGQTTAWQLGKFGKEGGLSSGGPLAGTYTCGQQTATIKRDNHYTPQIAEVMASTLINSVLPGRAARVELVRPAWSQVNQKDKERAWKDVYLASYHHLQFLDIMSEAATVKKAFGGSFNPVKYITPMLRAGRILESNFPEGCGLCNLQTLQQALIGDLLVANNDMHLGNMVLVRSPGTEPEVQAFDFGAAFNMEDGIIDARNNNHRVAFLFNYRGAIKTETVNHLANYPASWTIENVDFWKQVAMLPDFPADVWPRMFGELRNFFSDEILVKFLQKRVKVGQLSLSRPRPMNELLEILIKQFAALMQQRLQNFRNDALEMLHVLKADAD
jgi:hypothetical protein